MALIHKNWWVYGVDYQRLIQNPNHPIREINLQIIRFFFYFSKQNSFGCSFIAVQMDLTHTNCQILLAESLTEFLSALYTGELLLTMRFTS